MKKTLSFQLQPPTYGNLITILSIDRVGVRGIIPATILAFLEPQLQTTLMSLREQAGGLMTSMLTATDENNRPLFAAKDIKPFYLEHCPKIFPQKRGLCGAIQKIYRSLRGPRYDGQYLHKVVKNFPCLDARLSDICIRTLAAPTYLPAYQFKNQDNEGNVRKFNLIDGGAAANNPVFKENPDFFPIKPTDYGCFLVISVGTGSPKTAEKYNAKKAARWGTLGWLHHGGFVPLVDVFTQASADMVDVHIAMLFQDLCSEQNYL
ncbi:hypothetical protein ACJW30_01G031400 [Castanea mollissima]